MSETLTLFDIPLTRRTDPATSFQAAEKVLHSGVFKGQKKAVFEAVKQRQGCTSAELARRMGVSRYVTARRLPDLERVGAVRKGPTSLCKVTNSPCVTWWIKESEV
jgi:hypothetical protein